MGVRIAAALLVVAQATLVLLLQPTSTLAQWYPPWVPSQHNFNLSCDDIDCGKGKCKVESNNTQSSNGSSYSYSYSYSYECECEPGWNKSSVDSHYQYLPCVIPNCSFNTSCPQNFTKHKPPFERLPKLPFDPIFTIDSCQWAVCGEGTCKNTSSFSYICECKPGYSNLVNISSLPCYRDCEGGTGQECEALGIGTMRSSTSSNSSSSGDTTTGNKAPWKLLGSLFILMVSLFAIA